MKPIQAVLFDLDGTLLDTAPDLLAALNRVRQEHNMPALPLPILRSIANQGSKAMVKLAFGIDENHPNLGALRQQFLAYYEENIASATRFFPQVEAVLEHLDAQNIPWGIVTNKLTRHTTVLLEALNYTHRPGCVICGDSLATFKPDPAPILHACELLKQTPENCIYVGDAATDVLASKAAGTPSLVALYGYIHESEDPLSWQADGYINEPSEIIGWLKQK
jgi:2-phosphoglycolate phosphatase